MLTLQTTDLNLDRFPQYSDPFEPFEVLEPKTQIMTTSGVAPNPSPANKLLGKVQDTDQVSRHPSPQPTHFSVPLGTLGGNGHRVLRSATVGYIAPEFKGRDEQIEQGQSAALTISSISLTCNSQEPYP